MQKIEDSVQVLDRLLRRGETVYGQLSCRDYLDIANRPGVNTGFGGSADVRSSRLADVQSALLQHQHFGVLSKADIGDTRSQSESSSAMPSDWVRGTMLVRANSVARGHSAVTVHVIQSIIRLLSEKLTPVIPLRGSISASGDLSPLSYIAGTLTGNHDIYVSNQDGSIMSADVALQNIDLKPIRLGPKEGLGLINGTAASAAVASLAIYEAQQLAVLSQILTAMATEALLGTAASFDPFLGQARPHRGQVEVAANITSFLQNSTLTRGLHPEGVKRHVTALYQDRYALRTASQWLGPQLEDLELAHEQISVELNSTTDNPLIDTEHGQIHHGGNFQAAAITAAMEKTRLSLQMMGRLMFAQSSELINPTLNNGLPPNLAADEPSTSFTFKGIDIGMAAYTSELGFLSNPVSSHVQSAEMHNQAVNSLALISARYTQEAIKLVSLMSASYLYTVCQALDLRVMQSIFLERLESELCNMVTDIFGKELAPDECGALFSKIWPALEESWLALSTKDASDRAQSAVRATTAHLIEAFMGLPQGKRDWAFDAVGAWQIRSGIKLLSTYEATRDAFFRSQPTAEYLGHAAKIMYNHVRHTLGVPFHRGLQDDPTQPVKDDRKRATLGSWISVIHEDLRSGGLHNVMMECCQTLPAATPLAANGNANGHA